MKHNYWLAWKMKHGLAPHGRTGGALHPQGWLARVLYKVFFTKYDQAERKPRTFNQSVGGALGPSGDTK